MINPTCYSWFEHFESLEEASKEFNAELSFGWNQKGKDSCLLFKDNLYVWAYVFEGETIQQVIDRINAITTLPRNVIR